MANPFASFNLRDLGAQGFKIQGQTARDLAGFSVAAAGDVNRDGIADLLVGTSGDGPNQGAYVVFGKTTGFDPLVDLNTVAAGTGGFRIVGEGGRDYAGARVAAGGDINGDGFADLMVSAYRNDSGGADAGAAYVIFGTAAGLTSTVNLSAIAGGTGGFKIQGQTGGNFAGQSIASGDFNGDGKSDILIGAGRSADLSGSAYVVFGKDTPFPGLVDLDTVALGTGGFRLTGSDPAVFAGRSVNSAGDFNADGIADLIVGGFGFGGNAWIVYGRTTGFSASRSLELAASGTGGFQIRGGGGASSVGYAAAGAGDVNGDGIADVVVGAPKDPEGGTDAGAAYVVFGGQIRTSSFVTTAQIAAGSGGFKIIGETLVGGASNGQAGQSVASAGDLNGDGLGDLVIGSIGAQFFERGAAYVVFGRAAGFTSPIRLADVAAGTGGFKIEGAGISSSVPTPSLGDNASRDVMSAADVNGDGLSDLIMGSRGNDRDRNGSDAGAAHVIFGKKETVSAGADSVGGSGAADVLNLGDGNDYGDGFAGDDSILGGLGDDILRGSAGNDVLDGFAGDDHLVGGRGADWLKGSFGNDTLFLSRGGAAGVVDAVADLTAVAGATVRNSDMRSSSGAVEAKSVNGRAITLDVLDGGNNRDGSDEFDGVVGTALADVLVLSAPGAEVYAGQNPTRRIIDIEFFDLGGGDDILSLTTTSATKYQIDVTALGGDGNDTLWTGSGFDNLVGGNGNDYLVGGFANDRMSGNAGADLFGFARGFGTDTVRDFNQTQGDKLRLRGFGEAVDTFAEIAPLITQGAFDVLVGADTRIALPDGTTILLSQFAGTLTAADFQIVA